MKKGFFIVFVLCMALLMAGPVFGDFGGAANQGQVILSSSIAEAQGPVNGQVLEIENLLKITHPTGLNTGQPPAIISGGNETETYVLAVKQEMETGTLFDDDPGNFVSAGVFEVRSSPLLEFHV